MKNLRFSRGGTSRNVALGSAAPLYRQVRELLAERISKGEWRPGTPLPSEPQLAEQLGVSISTVRAAVAELVKAQVLIRRQGKGTFISPRDELESAYRFFHVHPNAGDRARPVSEVLSISRGRATIYEAKRLAVATDAPVIRLRNLLRMEGVAVQTSDIVLPQVRFPRLSKRELQNAAQTLYGAYQVLHGVTVVQTEDKLTAGPAPVRVARLLVQPEGAPVITVERLARSVDGKPVETRVTWIRCDHYHLLIKHGGLA